MVAIFFVLYFSFLAVNAKNESDCELNMKHPNGSDISENEIFEYLINLGPVNKWTRPVKKTLKVIEVQLQLVLTHILEVASFFFIFKLSIKLSIE